MRIGFIHPVLGIGGAERLVIDAAVQLQQRGHQVVIVTARRDPANCFDDALSAGLDVRTYGQWLPTDIAGRVRAPCAIVRTAYAGAVMAARARCDVVFCDLIAHAIPLIRALTGAPIIFYCHYPDQLLTSQRSLLYRLYRVPIDGCERWGIDVADRVLVNSHFTAAAFRETFPTLGHVSPDVLYPGVACRPAAAGAAAAPDDEAMILTIGRYAPSKNLSLAVAAFAALRERLPAQAFQRVRLVIAGGYDPQLTESAQTLQALRAQVRSAQLDAQVQLRCSLSEAEKRELLSRCRCVVYTPEHEHFGFVPLEAMAAGKPIIAVGSGGPVETILHGETGWLCAPNATAFATALAAVLTSPETARAMGQRARAHVARQFSLQVFGERLDAVVRDLHASAAVVNGRGRRVAE